MNIFDQNDVVIAKIVSARKLCQPDGFELSVGEYRNHYQSTFTGYYTVAIVLDGEAEYHYEDRILHSHKDDIVFLDNYSPFYQKSLGDYYVYVINFVAYEGFLHRSNLFHPANTEIYLNMFKEAAAAFEQRKPGYMLMTISSLYKILATMKADRSEQEYPVSKMDKYVFATDYIHMHLADPQLSVERIAEELGISGTYLRRIFLEIAGTTPLKMIKTIRINSASELLETGGLSVAEAAVQCGFWDVSYFCREFKKILGCTPLAFQKKHHMAVAEGDKSAH